jgi:oxygen-dependent protoporphyrinogen oxidase
MQRIVVIGGGIAGLAAAHRINELASANGRSIDIKLLEASGRLGGAIASERVGEFLVEAGPDSFISEKPWALKLCDRIGLTHRLVSTQSAYQKIFIVHNGRLAALPEGFLLLAPTRLWPFIKTPLFSWSGKLRMASEIFLPRGELSGDESLGAFVRRRFGDEALERVAQPLLGGIYAADPDQLSLGATMPRFKEMERERRSVIYAMWSAQRQRAKKAETGSGARWSLFVTLAGGMQELVYTLAERLPDGCVRLNCAARALTLSADQKHWHVAVGDNEVISADAVILATPAFRAGQLVKPIAADAAVDLKNISYASTATINLAYRRKDFPQAPDSFGFVVPAIEKRKIMACTFSSLKYPGRAPENFILMRAFVGGSLQPHQFNETDADMERTVRDELTSLLGVTATPIFSRIWRHPKSMPQYHVGHEALVKRIEGALQSFPTLTLAGSAYHGVGISDCVRTGEDAAEKVFARVLSTL